MQLTYRAATAGGWTLIARGSSFVVLEPAAVAFVDSVREALAGDAPVEAVVGALTSDGFARTPSFALVETTADGDGMGDVRVIVRGGLDLDITDSSGSHTVSGSGISTWTERGFSAVTSATLTVSGALPADDVPALVLEIGDAFVASIMLGAVDSSRQSQAVPATSVPSPQPEPERESEPEPEPEPRPEPVAAASEMTVAAIPDATLDDGDTVVRPRKSATSAPNPDTVLSVPASDTVSSIPDEGDRAGVATGQPTAASEAPEEAPLGDHDGDTVLSSDLPKRQGAKPAASATPAAPTPRLELSGGASELLDRPILVGRAPSVSKVPGAQMPRLVTIGTADHDISRNHAQFTLEGGTVVITDLHSRNGTLVVLPGKGPQKLRAGEPTAVIVGTVVDFGGGVTMTVRDS